MWVPHLKIQRHLFGSGPNTMLGTYEGLGLLNCPQWAVQWHLLPRATACAWTMHHSEASPLPLSQLLHLACVSWNPEPAPLHVS